MATRASIKISNSDGSFVANIYHHYDGYPEALGARVMDVFICTLRMILDSVVKNTCMKLLKTQMAVTRLF
jgi:hypothetical protein